MMGRAMSSNKVPSFIGVSHSQMGGLYLQMQPRLQLAVTHFSSECTVERIILLGLSPGAKTALIEPGNKKVEIELGPLFIQGNRGSVPTIRKPNVRITDDWSIQIL